MASLLIIHNKDISNTHLKQFIRDLRQSDFVELENCGLSTSILDGLVDARDEGEHCHMAIEVSTGKPVALWGLGKHNDHVGVVWMLATERLKKYPRSVLSMGKAFIYGCLTKCDVLANHVDLTNKEAVRLIERLGGKLVGEVFDGNLGNPIQKFEFSRGLKHV